MGIEIRVDCDGFKCGRSTSFDGSIEDFDSFLLHRGWHEIDGGFYCEKCGPEVLKEAEESLRTRESGGGCGSVCIAGAIKPGLSIVYRRPSC